MTHIFKSILNTNLSTQAKSQFLAKLLAMKNVNEGTVKLFPNPK